MDQWYHKQKMTLVVVVVVVVAEMFSKCPKASTSSNCPSETQYNTFSSLVNYALDKAGQNCLTFQSVYMRV